MFVFVTFCFILFIQFIYYFFIFGRFAFATQQTHKSLNKPVSIIICAKNEEENLDKFLSNIAEQDYPLFEIVLVDDASTDNTLDKMLTFKKKFDGDQIHIQIITINTKSSKGKKGALSLGITAAQHDLLLLTDADCKPNSNRWIREMCSLFSDQKTVVLGYGAYQKNKNSFLNKLIRFETLITAIQYFSYAKMGSAYMGVGRNIAYRKTEFSKIGGFKNHLEILSGDDDLLINEISTPRNTAICYQKDSFTISEPKTNFKEWIDQKRRHITTASKYKASHQISLGLFYISQVLFWILALVLIIFQVNIPLTLLLIFIRFLIWYLIISRSAIKLQEKDLLTFAPIFEISIIFIQFYIFIKNIIALPKNW